MIRSRLIIGLLLTVALMAVPAIATAATFTTTGTSTGTATAQAPEPAATCNPTAPGSASDFVCDFDIAGTFTLSTLGTGTYTGTTRLDWSIYTSAEPCAELTGTMTLTNAQGSIALDIEDTSRVCETADPDVHTSGMDATVTGGTGAYAGAAGTFTGTGTLTATNTAGEYATADTLSGSVTVPDPTATPTPTPTPTVSVAVPTSPAATPAVGALPDTSAPSNAASSAVVAVLAASFIGSLATIGHRARRTRSMR